MEETLQIPCLELIEGHSSLLRENKCVTTVSDVLDFFSVLSSVRSTFFVQSIDTRAFSKLSFFYLEGPRCGPN